MKQHHQGKSPKQIADSSAFFVIALSIFLFILAYLFFSLNSAAADGFKITAKSIATTRPETKVFELTTEAAADSILNIYTTGLNVSGKLNATIITATHELYFERMEVVYLKNGEIKLKAIKQRK